MLMYLGDLNRVELSFIYLGDSMLFVSPVFRAFQAPIVGDPKVSLLDFYPKDFPELWLERYELCDYRFASYVFPVGSFSSFLDPSIYPLR